MCGWNQCGWMDGWTDDLTSLEVKTVESANCGCWQFDDIFLKFSSLDDRAAKTNAKAEKSEK